MVGGGTHSVLQARDIHIVHITSGNLARYEKCHKSKRHIYLM